MLLEMTNISKDFAGGRVLHSVDFAVAAGEVHALVGENGAGKSTLMKILAGVYPDYEGTVRLRGEEIKMRDPRTAISNGVAVIYQEFALVPDLTVAENIALGREGGTSSLAGLSRRAIRERSAREAASTGIELPLDERVADLGVADQQMTEIVKAVARQAAVLVMDEPTARLASGERDRLFTIVRGLAQRGVGIIYISHFLEEIFSVSGRVTVLRDGRRLACRATSELDLAALAKLMVGEKYQEIDRPPRHATRREHDHVPPALRLRQLAVEGSLSPVTLELAPGEVVGVAGLQGSGQTELVAAIMGVAAGASGAVETARWRGLPTSPRQAVTAGILLVPADRKNKGLIAERPVSENIALAALRRQLASWGFIRQSRARLLVLDMVTRFSVHPRAPEVTVRTLSGGNQQKVVLSRAVAAGATVLILEQPTAGVDVGAKAEIYDQVDRLTTNGAGVLLVSDDLAELIRLSDRIVFVRNGVASEPLPASQFDRSSLLEAITGGVARSNGVAASSLAEPVL